MQYCRENFVFIFQRNQTYEIVILKYFVLQANREKSIGIFRELIIFFDVIGFCRKYVIYMLWKKGRKSIQAVGGLDCAQDRSQIGGSQNLYRMRTGNKGIETLL